MTYDDRVDDPKENERIISSGGVIVNGRVYGALMLSRSFEIGQLNHMELLWILI